MHAELKMKPLFGHIGRTSFHVRMKLKTACYNSVPASSNAPPVPVLLPSADEAVPVREIANLPRTDAPGWPPVQGRVEVIDKRLLW